MQRKPEQAPAPRQPPRERFGNGPRQPRSWHSIGTLVLLTIAFLFPTAHAEEEYLLPDQAFPISGQAEGPDAVRVRWDIADGYYLYQSKLRFESDTAGIEVGRPDLPKAEIKEDEFFGKVPIYRGGLKIRLPITRAPSAGRTLALQITSQGCADAGLCYPPHRQRLLLELPEPAQAESASSAIGASVAASGTALPASPTLGAGQSLGRGGEDEILDVGDAFRFQAEVTAPDRLQLTWDIAPGTYLYRNRLDVSLADAPGVSLGAFERPAGDVKHDSVLPDGEIGDVEVYHGRIDLTLPLVRGSAAPTQVTLVAKYQGCAEVGICYPPQTQRIALSLPEAPASTGTLAAETKPADPAASSHQPSAPADVRAVDTDALPVSEQDRIAAVLAGKSLWAIIAAFFGFGLLLAFTPCVFPMIPDPVRDHRRSGRGHHDP